jgi:hypothetical protein
MSVESAPIERREAATLRHVGSMWRARCDLVSLRALDPRPAARDAPQTFNGRRVEMSVTGNQPFAVLLCMVSDQNQQPQTQAFVTQFIAEMDSYWSSVSNGQVSIKNSQVFNWTTLSQTTAQLKALSRAAKVSACKAAFSNVDFSKFYGVIAIINITADAGNDGGPNVLIDQGGTLIPGFASHEMGHAFGLWHSFDDSPNAHDAGDDNRPGAYGDGWCIMSWANFGGDNPTFPTTFGPAGPGLCAQYRDQLGWIASNRISTDLKTETITLASLNMPSAAGYLVKHIPLPDGRYYTLEFRQKEGFDIALPEDAVIIHLVRDGKAELLRTQGGPGRTQGNVFVDNSGTPTITIKVTDIDSHGHTATVDITVSDAGPPAIGDPAALATTGQQHIFYRGAEGVIFHVFYNGSNLTVEEWCGPGSQLTALASASKPATLHGAAATDQIIYYRGVDDCIYRVCWSQQPGLTWLRVSGPNSQTGAPSAQGDPATLRANDQEHVFYRTSAGGIEHVYLDSNLNAHSEPWAGAGAAAPAAQDDPATLVANNQ